MLKLTSRDQFQTLHDAGVLQADAPETPAIIYVATDADPITITRGHFQQQARRYASALAAQGIGDRDLVVIAHTQNLESIYAFWGALLIGAIPSMFPTLTEKLDRSVYMRDMATLIKLSEVKLVLTTDEFAPELREVVACEVLGSSQITGDDPVPTHVPQAADVAFLQHSSGTTGLQKGVALSHQAVLNQLASYGDALQLNNKDVVVSWLPLYHDMGLIAGFLLPLLQGIPLVLMSPFDWVRHPALLLKAIHEYQATLCWLPNFAYNHMASRIRQRDSEGLSLASMRAFINCSEPVHSYSHQQFIERYADNGIRPEMLTVSYAMAENTFAVTQTPIGQTPKLDIVDRAALQEQGLAKPAHNDDKLTLVSCGAAITYTEVQALSDDGNTLPERRVGELAVRSNCMLSEYYKRPDLQPFVAGWYRTGDRGYIAAGQVYVIGRSKDLIINAGKNVYPQDLEAVINTIGGVHPGRAVVFGVPDEREGTELIAIVAETDTASDDKKGRKALAAQIRRQIAQQTSVTVNYVHLVERGWLLKTSSGKLARAANREKWQRETGRI